MAIDVGRRLIKRVYLYLYCMHVNAIYVWKCLEREEEREEDERERERESERKSERKREKERSMVRVEDYS